MRNPKRRLRAAILRSTALTLFLATSHPPSGFATPPSGASGSSRPQIADLPFATSQYIEGSQYGLKGDGKSDNTQAFQAMLGGGDRTIRIAPGDYVTGGLVIPRRTILLLDPGVVLRYSGKSLPGEQQINIFDGDVYIRGRGAKVIADRSGVQHEGVFIYGASNVTVDGLESSYHSGDGFYIGGPAGKPADHITLENCIASNNRRQGLSITSGKDVTVSNCAFEFTHGAPPGFGIDIEPNRPSDPLDRIRISRVRTVSNRGGGICVYVSGVKAPMDVRITGHESVGERYPYWHVGVRAARGRVSYEP